MTADVPAQRTERSIPTSNVRPYVDAATPWCLANSPASRLVCTLAKGHDGAHSAGGSRIDGSDLCTVFKEWAVAPPEPRWTDPAPTDLGITDEQLGHFKVCDCHDSWDQCPCAEGGHPADGSCDCCGDGICGSLPKPAPADLPLTEAIAVERLVLDEQQPESIRDAAARYDDALTAVAVAADAEQMAEEHYADRCAETTVARREAAEARLALLALLGGAA